MFYSFHFQSECCPNYINLFLSLSCFNRSGFEFYLVHYTLDSCFCNLQVLFILSSLASLFNRSVVRIWYSLFLIYLVSTRVISIPSCPLCSSFIALQLQGSHDVPCFSFLSECYQFRSTLLCSSFNFSTSQGSLVSLVCQRSNLVLPLLFLFRFSPVPS